MITTATDTSTAAAFRFAADLIETEGYDRHAETRSPDGYSVIGALDAAAGHFDVFSDSLWSAFCGWLVSREMVTGSDDAGIARWETDGRGRGQLEAAGELRAAADSFSPRRKLDALEITLIRQARDLSAVRGSNEIAGWLNANGRPDVYPEHAHVVGFGAAQSLIVSLARIIDDLTA